MRLAFQHPSPNTQHPTLVLYAFTWLFTLSANAQLSTNADKFLGNITTGWQHDVDYQNLKFYEMWNQLTPENATKWDACEPQRGTFNWTGADKSYNYAKDYQIPMKFHTLIWGSQYPQWMNSLSTEQQFAAIVEWMDAVKARSPDLPLIDVVNEAIEGHNPAPYKAALGGDGITGYDWIIKAFEMAHERWPDAILIYNDYNTFQWQKTQFIDLVRTLRNAGAPIDAYGCQSHDLNEINVTTFKNSLDEIQQALRIPMYITEYDINIENDEQQKQRFMEQIPLVWEADYCAGVTLWGYIYGKTWLDHSGLIRNGVERLPRHEEGSLCVYQARLYPCVKGRAGAYPRPCDYENQNRQQREALCQRCAHGNDDLIPLCGHLYANIVGQLYVEGRCDSY